ncbi:hypothetical protein, unlikely [Trypanosoma brucei gambiense DAL972]|uniref:Uncharacterized protein n=1 Tax=Trypanosoma brucei gambiense (strain MHOM/CI/86/DAL972) TaxID=679716 RepID=C9ZZ91_TRYB9|nr:hypothetical protein, unlikely [Trypanosoma brucei gambiense DAL972]CBH14740.1 hypothetical protein, unlikely [Trypanosoma brucei gambiense DAL972]|eukprot:XP_011777006.1 hypothetical protein, unlikely [Trypanosoma brucei gambiense DAL972]
MSHLAESITGQIAHISEQDSRECKHITQTTACIPPSFFKGGECPHHTIHYVLTVSQAYLLQNLWTSEVMTIPSGALLFDRCRIDYTSYQRDSLSERFEMKTPIS